MNEERKTYSTVSEMVRDITGDEELSKELESIFAKSKRVKMIFAKRCKYGLDTRTLSDLSGISENRLSQIENGIDDEVSETEFNAIESVFERFI